MILPPSVGDAVGREPATGHPETTAPLLSIGEAARLASVSPSALRLWERQGLVSPARTPGRERRYGPSELARLQTIAQLRRVEGLNAAGIRRVLAERDARSGQGHRPGAASIGGAASTPARDAEIAARLRRLRTVRGLTLRAAGELTGLSASFISSLERGVTGASVATLQRLVAAYAGTLGELLRDPGADGRRLVRPGERRVLIAGNGVRIEDLATAPTVLESQLFVLDPGATSDGYYAHPGEELMYVLSGSLGVWLDDTEYYELAVGDALTFPSTIAHRFQALGPAETRLIWINTPPTF